MQVEKKLMFVTDSDNSKLFRIHWGLCTQNNLHLNISTMQETLRFFSLNVWWYLSCLFCAWMPFTKCNSIHRLENTCHSKLSCGFHGFGIHVIREKVKRWEYSCFVSEKHGSYFGNDSIGCQPEYKYTHTNDFRCVNHSELYEDKNDLAKRVEGRQGSWEGDGKRLLNMMKWRRRKKCVKIKCSLSGFVWMWHKNHLKLFALQNAL